MNILFLTLLPVSDIRERGIYTDLMRCFEKNGHQLYIVTPVERRFNKAGGYTDAGSVHYIRVRTLNIQKTNLMEKGLSTLLIESFFLHAIRRYCKNIKFGLIIYSTPPVTFSKIISFIKKRDNAIAYLLLKDIFPQNAVDLGMLHPKGPIHQYFRSKEKKLYGLSDHIGCMSPANCRYILQHNPGLDSNRVEVNPNSIEPVCYSSDAKKSSSVREKFGIPVNTVLFVYGGNIGKPQGIDFLMEVLQSNNMNAGAFFLIIGSGTEFSKLENWFQNNRPDNALLLKGLPKSEYDELLAACDVGMIFLDKRFTIPNFPSRLLSYLEFGMPVLAATDKSTDLGGIITHNEFGYWAESGNIKGVNIALAKLQSSKELRKQMGEKGNAFLYQNYHAENSYSIIMKHFKNV